MLTMTVAACAKKSVSLGVVNNHQNSVVQSSQSPTLTPNLPEIEIDIVSPRQSRSDLLDAPLPNGRVNDTGYRPDYTYTLFPSGGRKSQQLVLISPGGTKVNVPASVAILVDGPTRYFTKIKNSQGQDIKSFDMPIHPKNKNLLFFSTSEPLDPNWLKVRNRIYIYNLKNFELVEIYNEDSQKNSPVKGDGKGRILRTIGLDGSKVILLYDGPDNSPGICTRIWYHYRDRMGYLELSDIAGGLKPYTVPPYKIEEDRIDADKCLQELREFE